ncbi:unnamed protein product [Moneuplotes crassus]|uniref:Uncharacterized protein n=1 Tax=Euplotes crassus TaxID=5936 RepID=A0AAD1XQZ8_EUPCR|nr:unnamed protein product [Moneuplotes crassus]
MPRVVDTSYHEILSRPDYYDDAQKEEYLQKRIMDEILEDKTPPLPNREQELDYLKELEDEFRNDRWLNLRFRKLQAGPLRRPYKNAKELKKLQYLDYVTLFIAGSIMFLPLGIVVGRRMRYTQSGVPKVYFAKHLYRLPYNDPDGMAKNYFRLGLFATTSIAGLFLAGYFCPDHFKDEHFSRPDLKPSAPMVEDDEDTKRAKKQLFAHEYFVQDEEFNRRGFLYRIFRPNSADYNIRYEDRIKFDAPHNSYDPKTGGFPSAKNLHEHYW